MTTDAVTRGSTIAEGSGQVPSAAEPENEALVRARLVDLFTTMARIRRFEERTTELFARAPLAGGDRRCRGREAVAAGVCAALDIDDFIVSADRRPDLCLARGASLDRVLRELIGLNGHALAEVGHGTCVAADVNVLDAEDIGALEAAIAGDGGSTARPWHPSRVGVVFFDRLAGTPPALADLVDLADRRRLRLVFVRESLGGTCSTRHPTRRSGWPTDRTAGGAMPRRRVDGNDVTAVYDAVHAVVESVRRDAGPALVEAIVRDERDPLAWLEARIRFGDVASASLLEKILAGVDNEVSAAAGVAETALANSREGHR
jgi:acetoin:2,6-dichlorophenolindophenol oxidoreductase subunit alpha